MSCPSHSPTKLFSNVGAGADTGALQHQPIQQVAPGHGGQATPTERVPEVQGSLRVAGTFLTHFPIPLCANLLRVLVMLCHAVSCCVMLCYAVLHFGLRDR